MTPLTPWWKFIFAKHAGGNKESYEFLSLVPNQKFCKTLDWFSGANSVFLTEKVKPYRSLSSDKRKSVLHSMLGKDMFLFDGQKVCSTFMLKCFQFCRPVHSLVREIQFGFSRVRLIDHFREEHSSSRLVSSSRREALQRESIISFIERLIATFILSKSQCVSSVSWVVRTSLSK